jgi:RhtB (resistance to homoserine/threonine) family protein
MSGYDNMFIQFFSVGLLMLLSAMLPGPDFALVVKNTVLHSRRTGLFTSLGLGSASLVHITYCMLGLAVVISQSILFFNVIKYVGATYLIYLGITSLVSKHANHVTYSSQAVSHAHLSDRVAFRQGFLCNLLNPKATLFFLALFTVIIKPGTPIGWELVYATEMLAIIIAWFCSLVILLSHPRILCLLNKVEKYISTVLGICLIGFGATLALVKK